MTALSNKTLNYYSVHAVEFAKSTVDIEIREIRERFTTLLAPGDRILDFGCGSGRDTKAFLDAGFNVTATDGSLEMCEYAEMLTGISVRNELFQDLADVNAYDGIWACSSILHLPKKQLAEVFARMARALCPHGIVYTSFRHGKFEGVQNGRYFTDFTKPALRDFLANTAPEFTLKQLWSTIDVRPSKKGVFWLNVILRKL